MRRHSKRDRNAEHHGCSTHYGSPAGSEAMTGHVYVTAEKRQGIDDAPAGSRHRSQLSGPFERCIAPDSKCPVHTRVTTPPSEDKNDPRFTMGLYLDVIR